MFSCCIMTKEKHSLFSKHDDVITSKDEQRREEKVDFYRCAGTLTSTTLDIQNQSSPTLDKSFCRGTFIKLDEDSTNGSLSKLYENTRSNKGSRFGENITNRTFNTRLNENLTRDHHKQTRETTRSGENLTNKTPNTTRLDDTLANKNSYEVSRGNRIDGGHDTIDWFGGFDSHSDMMGRLEVMKRYLFWSCSGLFFLASLLLKSRI